MHKSLLSDKLDSNNKTTPPVSAARLLQILSGRGCGCVCVSSCACVCMCMPASKALSVSGSEKLIWTQAASKWVRKTERESEMCGRVHVQVRSEKSNSRYHADLVSDTVVCVTEDSSSDCPLVSWGVSTTLTPLCWLGHSFWLWLFSSVWAGTERQILNLGDKDRCGLV